MVVIARTANGPVRMDVEEFIASGLPLHIPARVELFVKFNGEVQMFFIVDAADVDVYGHGFKSRDDVDLILSEIRNGWPAIVELVEPIQTGNVEPTMGTATAAQNEMKVIKRGKSHVIVDAVGNAVALPNDVENKFTNEIEAYTALLKIHA